MADDGSHRQFVCEWVTATPLNDQTSTLSPDFPCISSAFIVCTRERKPWTTAAAGRRADFPMEMCHLCLLGPGMFKTGLK